MTFQRALLLSLVVLPAAVACSGESVLVLDPDDGGVDAARDGGGSRGDAGRDADAGKSRDAGSDASVPACPPANVDVCGDPCPVDGQRCDTTRVRMCSGGIWLCAAMGSTPTGD